MKITEVYVCPIESQVKRWEVEYAGEKYLIDLAHMSRGTMTDDEWHHGSGIITVSDDSCFTYNLVNFGIAEEANKDLFTMLILRFRDARRKRNQEHE